VYAISLMDSRKEFSCKVLQMCSPKSHSTNIILKPV
jgi:hypothetical protein